jgi:hypothetical protein
MLFDKKGVKAIQIHLNDVALNRRERAYKRMQSEIWERLFYVVFGRPVTSASTEHGTAGTRFAGRSVRV